MSGATSARSARLWTRAHGRKEPLIAEHMLAVQPRTNRGDLSHGNHMGGSFCEPIEVKSKQHIGVAYQIPHFGPVNTIDETFMHHRPRRPGQQKI